MATVKLDAIKTAEIPIPHGYVFREGGNVAARLARLVLGRGGTLRAPCLAYVLRHPERGVVLVDTGMHPDAARNVRRDFGPAMGLLFRSLEPAAAPFDDQLRERGVDPHDVEAVVMTHLHADHTSGMRLLPRARFTCTGREWRAATRRWAASQGYVGRHLPDPGRMDLIDFEADGEPHGPFARTVDLDGDGSVRLLSTPGHSAGHLSVLARLDGGREVLIVGDAAYTLRSIREQRLPLFTADDERYRSTLRELKAFAEQRPDAILVPSHDPAAWQEFGHPSDVAARASTRAGKRREYA